MENLGKGTQATDASIANRLQEMEECSGVEDMLEEIDTLVKGNAKLKKFLTQDVQEMWDIMKTPPLSSNLATADIIISHTSPRLPRVTQSPYVSALHPLIKSQRLLFLLSFPFHPCPEAASEYPPSPNKPLK